MFVMVRYFSDRLLATDPLLAGFHVWETFNLGASWRTGKVHLLREPVASGSDPPVAEDVEGGHPEELLLGVGGPLRCGVDPGGAPRRADEDQPRHGKPEPCGGLERLPLQGYRPDLRRPPEGHYLAGLALVPPDGVLRQQPPRRNPGAG